MPANFWIKRALTIYLSVFIILLIIEHLKQHSLYDAVVFSLLWSLISTVIFIATRMYHLSKGRHCDLCNELPVKNEEKIKRNDNE